MNIESQTEQRTFGVHPGIILAIMREQAGSLEKALAELVMNSVDAGATHIEITIDNKGFMLNDDGKGFTDRSEIENFFEMFGTPHDEGDAYFGRFRIGRGQIMSYAKTTWRSGAFEMIVDIGDGAATSLDYVLNTHTEVRMGCSISGEFYGEYRSDDFMMDDRYGHIAKLRELVEYVPVKIILNGTQINTPPMECKWDFEDDYAWYKFGRAAEYLSVYNRGVFVCDEKTYSLDAGGTVVTKQALRLNMARNAIIKHSCPTWAAMRDRSIERLDKRMSRFRSLTLVEGSSFLEKLLVAPEEVSQAAINIVKDIKFIQDVFGELHSPATVFANTSFTIFDDAHLMVAEQVQRDGLAFVVMPSLFRKSRVDPASDHADQAFWAWRKLFGYKNTATFVDFSGYVEALDGPCTIIEESKLSIDSLIALQCLRELNDKHWKVFGKSRRKIMPGRSDVAKAWTDGASYIAFNCGTLARIRGGDFPIMHSGHARLVSILAHEYAHTCASIGSHGHDIDFYRRFHEVMMNQAVGGVIDTFQRLHLKALAAHERAVPKGLKYHGAKMIKLLEKAIKPATSRKKAGD